MNNTATCAAETCEPTVSHSIEKALPDSRVRLVPITSDAQQQRLRIASAWDGHKEMLCPTHLVTKRDEIVGCSSLGAVVFAHTWLNTEKCRGVDARRAIHDIETVCRAIGFKAGVIVSPPGAGLEKHLPDLGYQDLGELRLFLKDLTR